LKCPDCGKEMELKPGFWLCRKCSLQIPIKKSKTEIGYCTECGRFSQLLYDFGVSGLCEVCREEAKRVIKSLFENEEDKLARLLKEYRESRWGVKK